MKTIFKELDGVVLNEIKKLSVDPDYFHELKNGKKNNDEKPNKIQILNKEIKSIDDQISRFMDLYGIGKFTIDQVSDKVDPLNERRQALEKELNDLNADTGELTEAQTREVVKNFSDIMSRKDLNEIRLMIETLIYYIELDDDTVNIHWKFA